MHLGGAARRRARSRTRRRAIRGSAGGHSRIGGAGTSITQGSARFAECARAGKCCTYPIFATQALCDDRGRLRTTGSPRPVAARAPRAVNDSRDSTADELAGRSKPPCRPVPTKVDRPKKRPPKTVRFVLRAVLLSGRSEGGPFGAAPVPFRAALGWASLARALSLVADADPVDRVGAGGGSSRDMECNPGARGLLDARVRRVRRVGCGAHVAARSGEDC
jgi:hypothetical protein